MTMMTTNEFVDTQTKTMVKYLESIEVPKWMMDEFGSKIEKHYLFTKQNRGICQVCGHQHQFNYNMHNEKITCVCGKELDIRTHRSNTNFNQYSEYGCVQFFLRVGNIFIRKSYTYIQKHFIDRSYIELDPIEYQSLEGLKLFSVSRTSYYWRPIEDSWITRRYNFVEFSTSGIKPLIQIYPDLKEYINGTDIQYSQIDQFMLLQKEEVLSFDKFIILRKYPILELFWKAGLHELYSQFVKNESGKREVIKFSKLYRKDMIRLNVDMKFIRWYNEELVQKKLLTYNLSIDEMLRIYKLTDGSRYSLEKMLETVEELKKVANIRRALKYDHLASLTYRDYLRMMAKIGTPVKNITQAFPDNLETAHDDAVRKFNLIKQEADNGKYESIKNTLSNFQYESSGLCIIVPNNTKSISDEGVELKHCVGSYIDRILNNETVILFIRKTDDINKPYYTLEYRDGKVIQCRGLKNQVMNDEVKAFVQEWESWLNKPKQKKVRMQPSNQMVMQG